MYSNVNVYLSSNGSSFERILLAEGNLREVNFEKDSVHPLLLKASQIQPGDYQAILDFFHDAQKDAEFTQSVTFSHINIRGGDCYDKNDFAHSQAHFLKGVSHQCDILSLIPFIQEKKEIAELSGIRYIFHHSTKRLLKTAEKVTVNTLGFFIAPFALPALLGASLLFYASKKIFNTVKDH
ncbi:MAG: hypothetical protein S4CHLAM6_09090 [Chlamydiae bacterium]|nr:hypothetical protein [Chlamydiota bacterium]